VVGIPTTLCDLLASLGLCAKIAHSQSKQYRFKSNQRFRMSQPITNGSQWCILPIENRGQTSRCISAETAGGMLALALLRPQQRRFAGTRSLVGIGRLAALILTVLRA
jgi:hypothetical protein